MYNIDAMKKNLWLVLLMTDEGGYGNLPQAKNSRKIFYRFD